MLLYLFLLFTIVPALELYILLKVGAYLGAFNTILLIIFTGIYGAYWARLEGLRTLFSFQKDLQENIMPTDKILDGLLILIGGVLMITPGLVTDIVGLFLIFPFSRVFIKSWLMRKLKNKINRDRDIIDVDI